MCWGPSRREGLLPGEVLVGGAQVSGPWRWEIVGVLR